MYKLSQDPKVGNERFEGYGIDLVEELAQRLGFNYTIQLVEALEGKHDGMVKEVAERIADFAIADLTVTEDRQRKVDFTMPVIYLTLLYLFIHTPASMSQLLIV